MMRKDRKKTFLKLLEIRTNPETWNFSQQEAAISLKVSKPTIERIEADDAFWKEVHRLNKQRNRRVDGAIWKSLTNCAKGGSFFHQKLYFEMTGQYNEKLTVEGGENPLQVEQTVLFKDMSDEDLKKMIEE